MGVILSKTDLLLGAVPQVCTVAQEALFLEISISRATFVIVVSALWRMFPTGDNFHSDEVSWRSVTSVHSCKHQMSREFLKT